MITVLPITYIIPPVTETRAPASLTPFLYLERISQHSKVDRCRVQLVEFIVVLMILIIRIKPHRVNVEFSRLYCMLTKINFNHNTLK